MKARRALGAVAALWLATAEGVRGQGALLDRALGDFWGAEEASDREGKTSAILRLDAPFDALYTRLASGPVYSKSVKTGLVELSRKGSNGVRHEYVFLVPEDYDPQKKYRVCFYLHGGVSRAEPWKKGETWWRRFDRFDGREQISVFPSSWRGALWWQSSQIENLEAILGRLKSEYNVDENAVYLFGVSDGGTGVFYHAFKAPTPWAALFAFIGHPAVLENPATGVDGAMFVGNLANRPLYVVNGEKDHLYPANRVRPYVETFLQAGVDVVFRAQPGGHNTRWWNAERHTIDAFMAEHPRDPLPDRLYWETERPDRFPRIHWLVIDELSGASEGLASGRIALTRRGNVVEVESRGVSRFRLLLSPEQFDFAEPVEVLTNGVRSFHGKVERASETLLHWAARDYDRTMLFGAELAVRVPGD